MTLTFLSVSEISESESYSKKGADPEIIFDSSKLNDKTIRTDFDFVYTDRGRLYDLRVQTFFTVDKDDKPITTQQCQEIVQISFDNFIDELKTRQTIPFPIPPSLSPSDMNSSATHLKGIVDTYW